MEIYGTDFDKVSFSQPNGCIKGNELIFDEDGICDIIDRLGKKAIAKAIHIDSSGVSGFVKIHLVRDFSIGPIEVFTLHEVVSGDQKNGLVFNKISNGTGSTVVFDSHLTIYL